MPMAMTKPKLVPEISFGQIITSVLLAVIIGGGAWIATKDRNDVDLDKRLTALGLQISGLDGKMDLLSQAQNASNTRADLMDLRLKTVEDQTREARSEGATFQRDTDNHVNEVDARVRVLESYKGRGR